MAKSLSQWPSFHVYPFDGRAGEARDDAYKFATEQRERGFQNVKVIHHKTGGAFQRGWYQVRNSLTRNPSRKSPKGWIPASAVKISRNKGKVEVRIRKRR